MANPGAFRTTAHLVGHCIREIESALRDILEPLAGPGEPISHDDRAARLVAKLNLPEEHVARTTKLVLTLLRGIKPEKPGHAEEIRQIITWLELDEDDPVAKMWLGVTGRKSEDALHKRAHRRDLEAPRKVDREFHEFWDRMQAILEYVLHKTEGRFSEFREVLRPLLDKGQPEAADLDLLRDHVPNSPLVLGDFFYNLKHPGWVQPLWQAGFFARPPDPVRNPEEGTIMFPPCEQSRFLARMARTEDREVQEAVFNAIRDMPETENERVHYDLAQAANALPGDLAARLTEKARGWLTMYATLVSQELGKLASKLARDGRTPEAMTLLRHLLSLNPDESYDPSKDEDDPFNSPSPTRRVRDWDYTKIREECVPVLAQAAGVDALQLFVSLLDEAITLSHRRSDPEDRYDVSEFWRPAVEDAEQNRHQDDPECQLTIAVRDTAEIVITESIAPLYDVLAVLGEGSWSIFDRIAMHLLRVTPDVPQELLARWLLNQDLMDEANVRHEYYHLLKNRFTDLTNADQQQLVDLVFADRECETWSEDREVMGEPVTREELEDYRRRRIFDLLEAIQDHLPTDARKNFDDLAADMASREHPDFPYYSEGARFVGPNSPKTAKELGRLEVSALVEFLREWEPPGHALEGDSMEGLGRILTEVIKEDPERYARDAMLFRGLDPTYVRSVIEGFRQANRDKNSFDIQPVIELCAWTAQQVGEREESPQYRDRDPGWSWSHRAVASFLNEALRLKHNPIRITVRDVVWTTLQTLAENPDPTPEHEERFGGSNMDPATLAINSTRSEAISAVIAYGLWIKNIEIDGDEAARWSFDQAPEARDVLDRHLDAGADPSLAVRAVYGREFPLLTGLDKSWAEQAAPRVFSEDPDKRALWDAAWDTFVAYRRAYTNVYAILKGTYESAVERIGTYNPDVRHFADPDQKLGEHLIQLYVLGIFGDTPSGLLEDYFKRATPEDRRHALDFMGRGLGKGELPPEVRARLQVLIDHRLATLQEGEDATELSAFGDWFASRQFSDDWSYHTLKESLRRGANLGYSKEAYQRLRDDTGQRGQDVLDCLETLIESAEPWQLEYHKDSIRAILATAKNQRDHQPQAVRIVNRLIAKGYNSYQDLLDNS